MSWRPKRQAGAQVRFIHLDARQSGPAAVGYIALVPGADAPLLALHLPPGLQGGAREQVAWRQVQDQLGVTPKQVEMRPYIGEGTAHWTRVVLASSDLMTGWRAKLTPGCRAMLPDYLGLPAASDLWVLAAQGDRIRVRLGLADGFSGEADLAHKMLAQRLATVDVPKPKAVVLLEGELPGLQALLAEHEIALVQERSGLTPLGIAAPVLLGHGELSADLRIDAYAARAGLRRQGLPWVAALLAAGLMVGIWAVGESLEIRQMQRHHAALQQNVESLVRDHFVPSGPLLDVRLQVSRALAARQGEVAAGAGRLSPLLLIHQVADVMVDAGLQPEAVEYRQDDGLVLDLRLGDFAALDHLVTAFERGGIAAEPRGARVDEAAVGGIRTKLHLQVHQSEREQ